jgi:hypothetical protein
MRILPTLCVSGWLVAAVALPSLSAVELLAGGVAQAQQLGPPETSGLNRIQKEPFDPFQSEPLFGWYQGLVGGVEPSNPPANNLPTSDGLSSLWLNSAGDFLIGYSAEQAARASRDLKLFFQLSFRTLNSPTPGKGDHSAPGEVDRPLGPR